MNDHQKRERLDRLRELAKSIDDEITLLADELSRATPLGTKRSRKVIPKCGTESAYQRHHYRGETADEACLAGHALYVKAGLLRRIEQARAAS